MSWEWVAPVATAASGITGIYFTWLTGSQGREQVIELAQRSEAERDRSRIIAERRDAYLAALLIARIDLRRAELATNADKESLAKLDRTWSLRRRQEMAMDARVRLEVFGTGKASARLNEWMKAYDKQDYPEMLRLYLDYLDVMRDELQAASAIRRAESGKS
jgi:hypothetical protein